MTGAYGSTFIADVLGTPLSRLHYWDRTNLLKPSVRPAAGTGTRRLYSYEDLIALEVIEELRRYGLSLQRMRRCVVFLRRYFPTVAQPLAELTFLTDGESIFVVAEDCDTVIDTLKAQAVLSIPLSHIMRRVAEEVARATSQVRETVTVDGKEYTVTIERDPEGGWYIAFCEEIPGCGTQGRSLDDVRGMIQDAIRQCSIVLEETLDHAEKQETAS